VHHRLSNDRYLKQGGRSDGDEELSPALRLKRGEPLRQPV
jgi:hypothetical protein